MTTPDQDKRMAGIARELAAALHGFARERDDGHKKQIAQLHTDLCAAMRAELELEKEAARALTETEAAE